jgi:hypothetical protein
MLTDMAAPSHDALTLRAAHLSNIANELARLGDGKTPVESAAVIGLLKREIAATIERTLLTAPIGEFSGTVVSWRPRESSRR